MPELPHAAHGLRAHEVDQSHWIDNPNATTTRETGRANACNLCHLDRSLGWSADRLAEWYVQPRPALTQDERTGVADGIRWALTGNAHQRAASRLARMGWSDAKQAAGPSGWATSSGICSRIPNNRPLCRRPVARAARARAGDSGRLPGAAEGRPGCGGDDGLLARGGGGSPRAGSRIARRVYSADGRLDDATFRAARREPRRSGQPDLRE
ncbi:MAG: hypothetical protein R3E53_02460 [Myxococcota bacterium]